MSSLFRELTESESPDSSDNGMSNSEEDGSTDSYICDVCSGFGERGHSRALFNLNSDDVPDEMRYTYFYFHYPNPVLLADSAKNGCQVCQLIMSDIRDLWNIQLDHLSWEDVQEEVQDLENKRLATWAELMQDDIFNFDPDQDAAGLAKRIEAARLDGHSMLPSSAVHGKGRICLMVLCKSDQKSLRDISGVQTAQIEIVGDPLGSRSKFQGLAFLSSPPDRLDPGLLHRPTSDVFSREHLELVDRWIYECSTEHEACGRVGPLQHLPTRVLKIIPSETASDVEIVRLVETGGAVGCYAALSYCWGLTPQVEKTTTSNLHSHLDGISLQILPKTIADAIRLCCKLGFDYVWVDALCIIQDDYEDWTREAVKMSEVYGNSALTIVPSMVRDSSESFVEARRAGGFPIEIITELPYTDSESGLAGSLWFGDYLTWDNSWALERDWESMYTEKREPYEWLGRAWCFQEWILSPRILHIHNMSLWDCFQGYANEVTARHVGPTMLRRDLLGSGSSTTWSSIVAEFTSRAITKASDRLPALAGLAAMYARATGRSTYLAGIWFEDLPAALLWSGWTDDSSVGKLDSPSFTWVSADRAVNFYGPDVVYTPGDFEIKTRAVAWSCSEHGHPTYTSRGFTVEFEGPLGLVNGSMPSWSLRPLYNQWTLVLDRKGTCTEENIAVSKLYLMLIMGGRTESGLYEYQSLVLRKFEEENDVNCFQRLGRAYLKLEEGQAPPDMPPATPECAVWERSRFRLK
ncbi:hypothetical protein J7T55_007196 [Diaporthe amygdali]|uniref:uncharacterized protein n=1 Tax=Phomopsis amygdali TaxID=1214568 RepID=UPI0022FE3A82|nr:uncharacterized protein J7T55_007196 [Diaporthe amygdali]KAJ0108077.1 hypothetical protein J7T55_007196 [Diaporthe amygdali]